MSVSKFWSWLGEQNNFERLPKRIRLAIEARERKNEVLVRIIQLGIVCLFGVLYWLTPKTFPPDAFLTVPYVLAIYIVISSIGLIWAIRARLPSWSIYCSILFDFLLLYSLIISFHFQYMQPASFILKSPTLLYIFIFIALRTLRFEAKFVLAAGLTAALGWFLIVFYVIRVDADDPMITKSYIEYLTSNSVLIGAEIDKINSILAVTFVLTFSVHMSSKLLISSFQEADAARELSRFFDKSVADKIRQNDVPILAGQARNVRAAIVNIDLRNFTSLAQYENPERIMEILTNYQARIVPLIKANGGIVDKFMGDGIMASFGTEGGTDGGTDGGTEGDTEEPEGNCAKQAVEACEAILQDWARWSGELPDTLGQLEIGIAAAIGTVAFGAIGKDDRLEFTVIGPAVNLSARLEKLNKEHQTNCIFMDELWQEALAQGYNGALRGEQREQAINGTTGKTKIVLVNTCKSLT